VKRNWLLYLVIFSLALNFGTIGTFVYLRYQDKGPTLSGEMPPPLPMRDLWRDLKLDAGQRQAVRGLFPEHHAKVTELRKELFQKRQDLFGLIKGEAPAMGPVQAKVREISDLQAKLEEELVRHFLEFKKLLKPEQNEAFLNLVHTRMNQGMGGPLGGRGPRHGPGMGRGPGMGPGPGHGSPPGMGPGAGGPGSPD